MSADRNLLFGILALQMDFISRDALLTAMNAWVLEKHKLLGQILQERGAMDAEQRDAVEALIGAHLKAHGNDARQSLAALSSVRSVCHDLHQIADPDVHASLAHVAAHQRDPDPYATHPGDVPLAGRPRFRVLRPHARGGLGEVFVAQDEELHRQVALKEIQNRHADDPASRARFVLEAEITGGLEHPGIVPVYGLGHYPDGRPFYAMRFIRGDSLQEAVERFHQADQPGRDPRERNLALHGLLGRFVDVCNAVAYAHARGVLHRDLKPGNIMLGRYGETLVVDWGLAKPLGRVDPAADLTEGPLQPVSGSESAPTLTGQAIGTPAYMSPEQAAGRLDQLGPASDVYSLGATLYQLLTGRPPVDERDVAAALRRVQKGEFPPPRQVKVQIPAALEAVCRKAMRLRPADRYPTPQALAQDVERWRADEPVSAYREPLAARLGRWSRRHRGLVIGTAAAVAVATVSLAVGLAIVSSKNRALDQANSLLAATNSVLADTVVQEAAARTAAESRRQQAAERFSLALGAVKNLVFDVQEKLMNRPGTQQLRKALLNTALAGLERLAKDAEKTQDTDHTTAFAHLMMGDIFTQIDGQISRAQDEYQRGHLLYMRLSANPRDLEAQHRLALSYSKLGDVTLHLGQTQDARRYFEQGLEIVVRLAADDPKDVGAQRELAVAYEHLGDLSLRLDQTQDARRYFQKDLEVTQRLAVANPKDARAQRDLAFAYNKLGDLSLQLGQGRDALRSYQQGLDLRLRLAADPTDMQAQHDLTVCYHHLGDAALQLGQNQDARRFYQQGLEVASRLAATDPADVQAQRDLSVSYQRLGYITLQLGLHQEAKDSFQKDLEVTQRLAAIDPRDVQVQRDLAVSYENLGDVSLRLGQTQHAQRYYQSDLTIAQRLATADPHDPQAQRDLAVAYERLGNVSLKLGQVEEARRLYTRRLEVAQRLAAADPENLEAQTDLAVSYSKLGTAEEHDLAHARAARWFEQAGAVLSRLDQQGKLQGTRYAGWPAFMERERQFCQNVVRALDSMDAALALPPAQVPRVLDARARVLTRRGAHAEAAATAEKLAGLQPLAGSNLYDAACRLAQCTALAGRSPKPDQAARARYAARAVALLGQAQAVGYFKDLAKLEQLKTDKDLDPLRDRAEFQKLLAILAKTAKG
jgi:serine/threonine-protein kinase